MNEKDLDLLLSLIEGRLSAGDDAAVRSRLSQDPELRSELEMQRLAVARLQRLPQPSMTATEREHLHGSLRRELHLSPVAAAATTAPRSRFWARWAPISGVAVAALLLAGIVYVIPRTDDQSDTASDVVAADILEATTAASESAAEAPASAGGASETESGTDGASTDGASTDATPDSSSDDTAAAAAPEQSGESESGSLDTAGADQGDLADEPEDAPETESATVFVDPGADGTDAADEETTETTTGDTTSGETMLLGSIAGAVPSADELIASLGDRVEDRQSVIDYFMSGGSVGVDAHTTQTCAATLDSVGEGREAVPVAAGPGGEVLVFAFFETADWPFTIVLVAADGCTVMG